MDIFDKSNPSKQAASDLSAGEQDENRHGEVDEELEAGQPDHRMAEVWRYVLSRYTHYYLLTESWSF